MRLWLEEDISVLGPDISLDEVQNCVINALWEMRQEDWEIHYVAGPISADGEAKIPENIEKLIKTRCELMRGIADHALLFTAPFIFTPETYKRLELFELPPEEREQKMQEFWDGIIQSGEIDCIYFTPDWERSHGAQQEYRTASRNPHVRIVEL